MKTNCSRARFSFNQAWLVASLALAACSPAAAAIAPTTTPTAEPAATATSAPTLTATLEPEPTSTEAPSATETLSVAEALANSAFPTGKFFHANDDTAYFLFGEDGRWSHHAGGMTLATGEYRIEGDTFIQTKNSHGCPVPMSFKYTFDGEQLHFQLTEESRNDTCDIRIDRYDDKVYVLAEE